MSSSIIDLTRDGSSEHSAISKTPRAIVKLKSLDGELDREIIFSTQGNYLLSTNIGRASKNTCRLMLPAKGNAWIESPIVSRHHAKLFVDANDEQILYVCDLGSTHGTRLNDVLLNPNQEYPIATGAFLTFGMPITSRHETFEAKRFEVSCEWYHSHQPSSMPTPATSPEESTGPRTFRVPSPGPSTDEESDAEMELYAEGIRYSLGHDSKPPAPVKGAEVVNVKPSTGLTEDEVTFISEDSLPRASNIRSTADSMRAASLLPRQENSGPASQSTSPMRPEDNDRTMYALRYLTDDSVYDEELYSPDSSSEIVPQTDDLRESSPPYSPTSPRSSPSYCPGSPDLAQSPSLAPYSPGSPSMAPVSPSLPPFSPVQEDDYQIDVEPVVEEFDDRIHPQRLEAWNLFDEDDDFARVDEEGDSNSERGSYIDYPRSPSFEREQSCEDDYNDKEMVSQASDESANGDSDASLSANFAEGYLELDEMETTGTSDDRPTIAPENAHDANPLSKREPSPSDAAMPKSQIRPSTEPAPPRSTSSMAPGPGTRNGSECSGLLHSVDCPGPSCPPPPKPHHLPPPQLSAYYPYNTMATNSHYASQHPEANQSYCADSFRPYSEVSFAIPGWSSNSPQRAMTAAIEELSRRHPINTPLEHFPYSGGDQLIDIELGRADLESKESRARRMAEVQSTIRGGEPRAVVTPPPTDGRPIKPYIMHRDGKVMKTVLGTNNEKLKEHLQERVAKRTQILPISRLVNEDADMILGSTSSPSSSKRKSDEISSDIDELSGEKVGFGGHAADETSSSLEPVEMILASTIANSERTIKVCNSILQEKNVSARLPTLKTAARDETGEPAQKRAKTSRSWGKTVLSHGLIYLAGAASLAAALIATVPDDVISEAFSEL